MTKPTSQTKTLIPKYAHLDYHVLHELEISIPEYFLLDMIFRLSGNGSYYCNKKLENIAYDMRMSKRGVTDLRNRLIERKLLLKGIGNKLRTSEKVQKVYFIDESQLPKSAVSSKEMQKVHLKSAENVAKTPVENNKRLTLDNRGIKNRGSGYQKAASIAALLKQRAS